MAINAASWHIAAISAPEHPLVCTSHSNIKSCEIAFQVKGKVWITYQGGKCIKIESRFDGHVARTNAKNIHATSKIWRSYI